MPVFKLSTRSPISIAYKVIVTPMKSDPMIPNSINKESNISEN